MKSGNASCIEVTEKQPQLVVLRDATAPQQVPKLINQQPTAAEVSGLPFGLYDGRTHVQELSNEFARLLNRGSSLE